ncbi:MAG: winged helix-turn-helix domain-containing protein [Proteobacteria bacterium]|nr:winged helix-turn-helix domain-containing protein [Pseudomonadota bacterium]
MRELQRRFAKEKTIDLGSHEDFANWTGTTRETVTRTLTALESEGFIQKTNNSYRLLKAFEDSESWLSG